MANMNTNPFWNMKPKPTKLISKPMNKSVKPALFGFKFNPKPSHSQFFGIKPKVPITPIKLGLYPVRTKKEIKLIDRNPFGDKDKDKVPNIFDCRPTNKIFQGPKMLAVSGGRRKKKKNKTNDIYGWDRPEHRGIRAVIKRDAIDKEMREHNKWLKERRNKEREKNKKWSKAQVNKKLTELAKIEMSVSPKKILSPDEKTALFGQGRISEDEYYTDDEGRPLNEGFKKMLIEEDKREELRLEQLDKRKESPSIHVVGWSPKAQKAVDKIEASIKPSSTFHTEFEVTKDNKVIKTFKNRDEAWDYVDNNPGVKWNVKGTKPITGTKIYPIGHPKEHLNKPIKLKDDLMYPNDDDDYDYKEDERRENERREQYGLSPTEDEHMFDEGHSNIVRENKKRGVALIRHHDSYSPASESADTYEIKKKGKEKPLWDSGTTYTAEYLHEGASLDDISSGDREDAIKEYNKISLGENLKAEAQASMDKEPKIAERMETSAQDVDKE